MVARLNTAPTRPTPLAGVAQQILRQWCLPRNAFAPIPNPASAIPPQPVVWLHKERAEAPEPRLQRVHLATKALSSSGHDAMPKSVAA